MLLTGTLPPQIANLSSLTSLNLMNNSFYDSLSVQLANLHRLRFIELGEIPSDMFERLSKLQDLDLSLSWIRTSIPMSLFKCKELQIMNLAGCALGGILPKEIGNLTMLRSLDLSFNEIEGNGKLLDAVLVFYCLFQRVG
ncbi:hypothetical protein Gotri_027262 [Gossypium trilobum]|uniref:Uncharacterized protein n=1 Tax=Gossypium trilobum TaxID=34281 RepID=A0A7J9FGP9_9ROSI|nr:hypothetical protein [Gossypium trilobum]